MLLVIPHLGDNSAISCHFIMRNNLPYKLKQMVLKGDYQFREKSVVFLFVFAGGEATVYGHPTNNKNNNYRLSIT